MEIPEVEPRPEALGRCRTQPHDLAPADHVGEGLAGEGDVTVDLGFDETVEQLRGERAILIGFQLSERITAEEVARRLETINYEVTCALTPRVPRVYHRDGVPVDERGISLPARAVNADPA